MYYVICICNYRFSSHLSSQIVPFAMAPPCAAPGCAAPPATPAERPPRCTAAAGDAAGVAPRKARPPEVDVPRQPGWWFSMGFMVV